MTSTSKRVIPTVPNPALKHELQKYGESVVEESNDPSEVGQERQMTEQFEIDETGVFFIGSGTRIYVCAPLHVLAKTRDTRNGTWGRLLRWKDDDGEIHEWVMPMEVLEGDSNELRRELSSQGLKLPVTSSPRERLYLPTYIREHKQESRVRIIDKTGWHGNQYVTPSRVYGHGNEVLRFQSPSYPNEDHTISGTLEGWITNVSKKAVGNSRLTFAICAAFGGPALDLLNVQSGGFHMIGKSSSGKSILLSASASVWSSPKTFVRNWRSTSNGLEGIAAKSNDHFLILDELSQCSPKEAGAAAYMLANGQGKTRANRDGYVKTTSNWRLLFLSSGEESLSSLVSSAGESTKAGQEIRLAEFESDAGRGMGVFDSCQDHPNSAEFARALSSASQQYYGTAGPAFLEYLVENPEKAKELLDRYLERFRSQALRTKGSPQRERVADRFGLLSAVGELATRIGLTGWEEGDALASCLTCFHSWEEGYGIALKEDQLSKQRVKSFFEAHGESRFGDLNSSVDRIIHNKAGYYRTSTEGCRIYSVFTQVFRGEICRGMNYRTVEKYLASIGWLKVDKESSRLKVRLPGSKNPQRVYAFTEKVWEDQEDHDEEATNAIDSFSNDECIDF
jgi:putative DNA primase/helicase